ncbi:MAG TPA: universal stress protein, partial [Acidimicrobiia bacterium]
MKTIIVPLDGSEFAERALGPARALSARAGAPVVLMTSRIGGPEDPDTYLADAARRAGIGDSKNVVISD